MELSDHPHAPMPKSAVIPVSANSASARSATVAPASSVYGSAAAQVCAAPSKSAPITEHVAVTKGSSCPLVPLTVNVAATSRPASFWKAASSG